MQSKSLLIAIAAFAATAGGVQAYGGPQLLQKAGLTPIQISAFETAREKRQAGDITGARDVLMQAGVDEHVLHSLHKASKEARDAVHVAIQNQDYAAFVTAATGTPLADSIKTEDQFKQFVQANKLRQEGKFSEAKTVLDGLGVHDPKGIGPMGRHRAGMKMGHLFQSLTPAQRDALRAAHQANDKATERAILEEAGITMPGHRGQR